MRKIHFVSSNQGKREELLTLFSRYLDSVNANLEFIDLDIPEIQSSGEEIIKEKLNFCAQKLNSVVVCEDSALCFHAWNDFPGVYIKHVREAVGCEGLVKMLKAFDDKSARAECRIGLAVPGKETVFFVGKVEGSIVGPRGNRGFGWDSVFLPAGFDQTYAEMETEQKNIVSDRAQAVGLMVQFLENSPGWLVWD